jgi:hypothetical protein
VYLIAIEPETVHGRTRFADAVTNAGYTTVLPHPMSTLSFAGR